MIAVVGSLLLRSYARRQLFEHGRLIRIWPYVLGLLIGLPLLTSLVFGAPVTFEFPELKGFNFAGGSRVIPEFVALTLALSTYTGAFIAEIVRAGIQSVHKGQMEAGSSLGLARGSTLRLIVVPQALRVILPPLTNQYLNLTKNSSLAVAIGYPDLVSVFAGTTLSQTGQAIEIIAITMGVYLLISLVTSAIMSFYGWRLGPEPRRMSDTAAPSFVRQDLVPERAAPIKTTGFVGFLRTRLFNSPTNILLTIAGALLLWFTVVPTIKFLLVDAVWTGTDRNACLAENAGHAVGACWPFVQAKFSQFIYGFYPEAERWRVNLTFLLAALLLLPLLIPRLPAKGLNAGLFFVAFPVVAFFLLHGGGLQRLRRELDGGAVVGIYRQHRRRRPQAGRRRRGDRRDRTAAGVARQAGRMLLGTAALLGAVWPLIWLRDQIQAFGRPVWADFAATTAIVSMVMFCLSGGIRTGWRALIVSLAIFAGIGIVIAVMGLDRGGLPIVDTRLWGGLLVTLVVSVTGIVTSMPVGIALALGRRSTIPLIRIFSIAFIEFWRGVPLITVLFFATYMLPLFVPAGFTIDGSGAGADRHRAVRRRLSGRGDQGRPAGDPARAGRGGKRARPVLGEDHGADRDAAGAAPRHSRPRQQLHRVVQGHLAGVDRGVVRPARDRCARRSPIRSGRRRLRCSPALPSPGMIYFTFCFGMSRYSLFVENRLNAHQRN